ncbi:nicotinate-nucleotide adenylyltransferase, partial [bacterium]|nr:nicotinate-nucleotide adenylyltransferase [bacterium]
TKDEGRFFCFYLFRPSSFVPRPSDIRGTKEMQIGILGGTFNPLHTGHIEIADIVCKRLSLDKVLFIPTNISPDKCNEPCIKAEDRLKMLESVLKKNDRFDVLDIEIQRQGISYTIDTLKQLSGIFPKDEFFLIMGMDQFLALNTWKDYKKLFKYAKIVVLDRESLEIDKQYLDKYFKSLISNIIFLNIKPIIVSSTDIREMIKQGKDFAGFVPVEVYTYIGMHKLYQ